jgi:hypothetical protein
VPLCQCCVCLFCFSHRGSHCSVLFLSHRGASHCARPGCAWDGHGAGAGHHRRVRHIIQYAATGVLVGCGVVYSLWLTVMAHHRLQSSLFEPCTVLFGGDCGVSVSLSVCVSVCVCVFLCDECTVLRVRSLRTRSRRSSSRISLGKLHGHFSLFSSSPFLSIPSPFLGKLHGDILLLGKS